MTETSFISLFLQLLLQPQAAMLFLSMFFFFCFLFFFFPFSACWLGLSSLTRDQTCASYSQSVKSQSLAQQGSPRDVLSEVEITFVK